MNKDTFTKVRNQQLETEIQNTRQKNKNISQWSFYHKHRQKAMYPKINKDPETLVVSKLHIKQQQQNWLNSNCGSWATWEF